jgi:hypothetical protein
MKHPISIALRWSALEPALTHQRELVGIPDAAETNGSYFRAYRYLPYDRNAVSLVVVCH